MATRTNTRKTTSTKTATATKAETTTPVDLTKTIIENVAANEAISAIEDAGIAVETDAPAQELAATEFRTLFVEAATADETPDTFAVRVAFHNISPELRSVAHVEAMIAASQAGANPAKLATLIDEATKPIDGDPAISLAQSLAALDAVREAVLNDASDSTLARAIGMAKNLGDDATVASIATRLTSALSRGRGTRNASGVRGRRIATPNASRSAGRDHVSAWLANVTSQEGFTPGDFYPVSVIAGRESVVCLEGSPYDGSTPPSPNAIGNVVTGDFNDTPKAAEDDENGYVWVGQCQPRGVVVTTTKKAKAELARQTEAASERYQARQQKAELSLKG